jgi:hypothetical protein
MPPFGFGRKEQPQSFTTDITDKEDLEEIKEIAEMLNPNEEAFVVARQSRLKPGGSAFTPNIIFGTIEHNHNHWCFERNVFTNCPISLYRSLQW